MGLDANLARADGHIIQELGFVLTKTPDGFDGTAPVIPEICVPGTRAIRTSILATWTDLCAGHLALDAIAPRVPVTLELDVHVYPQRHWCDTIHAAARPIKIGRSVIVASVEFVDADGDPVAVGAASFMAAPDPRLEFRAATTEVMALANEPRRLEMPFAERAGCTITEPGTAVLHRSDDGMNASNTINGGLLALAVEEAALSLTPGTTLCSLAMRYVRPLRIGPAIATADVRDGVGRVEVRDGGDGDRLAVTATTRTFAG